MFLDLLSFEALSSRLEPDGLSGLFIQGSKIKEQEGVFVKMIFKLECLHNKQGGY